MKKRNKNNEKGFSILELTAVIAIVTFGMIGMLSLAIQSVKAQYINKNNLIASMLAQEGIELVRNYRDNYWIVGGTDWQTLFVPGDYTIDYTASALTGAVGGFANAQTVLLVNGTGLYQHSTGLPSSFRRLITVSNTDAASAVITCKVRYSSNNNNYDYVAETVLYDWR